MKKSFAALIIFSVWFFLFTVNNNYQRNTSPENGRCAENIIQEASKQKNKIYENYHNAYISEAEKYGDLEKIQGLESNDEKIFGGIVSHHFLAAPKIAEFFAGLKNQQVETIVVIGPNHFSYGEEDIQISKYPYNTPWGVLEPDSPAIENLLKKNFIKNEEIPFNREHSISALVGFIKYYLPTAKIVPIILKRSAPAKKAEKLAGALNEILPEKSIAIASVDFSHHLAKTSADFHDEFSLSVIKSFDYLRLYKLEIDSPPSIYAALKYLEKRNAQKITYTNINSADFTNQPDSDDTTSYAFAYFSSGAAEKENPISLLAFGNAVFGSDIQKMITGGKDPFDTIRGTDGNFFRGSDFVMINLKEINYAMKNCRETASSMKFISETGKALWKNQINLIDLTEYQTGNCHGEDINNIEIYLDNFYINYFGGNKAGKNYTTKTIGNKKIAFVGIGAAKQYSTIEESYSFIKELKIENDYVVAGAHWENEYSENPIQNEINIAHNLIDSGADIVIGNGPRNIQPLEIYKNKAIFYSLGDFITDQKNSSAREGMGIGVIFNENKKNQFFLFPFTVIDNQPSPFDYPERAEFCNKFLGGLEAFKLCYFEN